MRITFVISTLSAGGAERMMSILVNYFATQGYEITLITFDNLNSDFYRVDNTIQRYYLDALQVSKGFFHSLFINYRLWKRLRKAINQSNPDFVISFMAEVNVITILATRGLHIPTIIAERVDPRFQPIQRYWGILRLRFYRYATYLVIQTESVRQWAQQVTNPYQIVTIPNPAPAIPKTEGITPNNQIVTMGRLAHQKGHDLLIKSFAKIANEYPDWQLVIIGEGEKCADLEQIIQDNNLGDSIQLVGRIENPFPILQQAKVFVLPSRWEGFPNALLEAMACGVPVISFDCPSGPSDIIRHEVDGLLVPPEDIEALAAAMQRLMDNEDERQKFGERALEVTERFSIEKIMAQWEALFHQVIQNKK